MGHNLPQTSVLSNIVFQHLISEKFLFVILEDAQMDNREETQCYLFTQVLITIQIIKAKLDSVSWIPRMSSQEKVTLERSHSWSYWTFSVSFSIPLMPPGSIWLS